MEDFNVLITGCSAFTKEIIDCLKNNDEGVNVKVVGVNSNSYELLRVNVDYPFVVSPFTSPNYIEELLALCASYNVKVVLPYLTKELPILALQREKFKDIGVKLSVMEPDVLEVANNKITLYKFFPQHMPKQVIVKKGDDIKDLAHRLGYPNRICCKLSIGSGSQGFAIIDDEKANDIHIFGRTGNKRYITLDHLCMLVEKTDTDVILQEYKNGYDYSVCMLCDNGEVTTMIGYIGYSMENGAVMKGETVKNNKAYDISKEVAKELKLDGNICLDFIVNREEATLLEINPRLNATVGLCNAGGVNLPLLRCKQLLEESINVPAPKYGVKMNKYYESEYFV